MKPCSLLILFLFGVAACGRPHDLTAEAEQIAEANWYVQNDEWFGKFPDGTIVELWSVRPMMMEKPVSEDDRREGIEWAGDYYLDASAMMYRSGSGWSSWIDGKPHYSIVRKNGSWDVVLTMEPEAKFHLSGNAKCPSSEEVSKIIAEQPKN